MSQLLWVDCATGQGEGLRASTGGMRGIDAVYADAATAKGVVGMRKRSDGDAVPIASDSRGHMRCKGGRKTVSMPQTGSVWGSPCAIHVDSESATEERKKLVAAL